MILKAALILFGLGLAVIAITEFILNRLEKRGW